MNDDRKDYYIVVSEAEIIELKKAGIEFECKKANDQMIIKIDAKDKNTVEGILKIDDINKRSPKL